MSKRVILITGANGGLGAAMARGFLAESAENFVWLGVRERLERAVRSWRSAPAVASVWGWT